MWNTFHTIWGHIRYVIFCVKINDARIGHLSSKCKKLSRMFTYQRKLRPPGEELAILWPKDVHWKLFLSNVFQTLSSLHKPPFNRSQSLRTMSNLEKVICKSYLFKGHFPLNADEMSIWKGSSNYLSKEILFHQKMSMLFVVSTQFSSRKTKISLKRGWRIYNYKA